jgi:hypothetical protein
MLGPMPKIHVAGQGHDILEPFSKRGDMNLKRVDSEQKVFAKSAIFDHGFQVTVRRANNSGIDSECFVVTNAANIATLQNAKQFGLHREGQFADFIEEYCAAVGNFEQSIALHIGTGEGTFLVTEQFAFDQVFWKGTAVDRDERLIATKALLVHRTGNEFFAASGFASDQNCALCRRDLSNQFGDHFHGLGGPDQLGCLGFLAAFRAFHARRFAFERSTLGNAAEKGMKVR